MPSSLITTAELQAQGLVKCDIERVVRAGLIRPVRRGVYSLDPIPADPQARFAESCLAALQVAPPGSLVCFESAARLFGIALPSQADANVVHLLTARRQLGLSIAGVAIHDGRASRALLINGIPVTEKARTILDVAARLSPDWAMAAVDSAVHGEPGLLAHCRELAAGPDLPRRGRQRVRVALDRATGLAESPLESLALCHWSEAGLPPPEQQVEIRVGGRLVARVDFLWREARLVVEVDGLGKYADPLEIQREKRRQNDLVAAGFVVLRFTWADVTEHRDRTAALIHRELADRTVGQEPKTWRV